MMPKRPASAARKSTAKRARSEMYYSTAETIREYPRFKQCPCCKYLLVRYIDHVVEVVTYSHLDPLCLIHSDTLLYSAPRAVIEIACTHEDEEYEISPIPHEILQEHELDMPQEACTPLSADDISLLRSEVFGVLHGLGEGEFAHWYDAVTQSPTVERMLFAHRLSEAYLYDREVQTLIKSTIAAVTYGDSAQNAATSCQST